MKHSENTNYVEETVNDVDKVAPGTSITIPLIYNYNTEEPIDLIDEDLELYQRLAMRYSNIKIVKREDGVSIIIEKLIF